MSVDRGNRIKKTLLQQGVVKEQRVAVGRTRRLLLQVTTGARQRFGVKTQTVERGSLTHEYWKRWYAEKFEPQGFTVQLEAPRHKGYVDVLATRGSESVAIEVETGSSNILWNVRQNLLSGFKRVLIVATDKAAKQKVEQQLASAELIMERITVVLRDDVAEFV